MTGHDGRPIAAKLQIDGAAGAGAKAGQLRFGEPRQCSLTLVLARKAEGQSDFSLPTANGGWCDQLLGGSASVRLTGKDAVTVVLTAPRGGEVGRLVMQAAR